MKRKYLSALLMGTLTVASMSTFTSCKDYDDDISNLQGQIDKLATADQLSQKVAELQALISSNTSSIGTLQSALDEAKKAAEKAQTTADSKATLDQVNGILADYAKVSYVDDAKKSLNDAIEALKTGDITTLKADVEAAAKAAAAAKADAEAAIAEVKKDLENNYVTNATYKSEKEAAEAALETLKGQVKTNADAIVKLQAVDVVTKADLVAKLGEYATAQQAKDLQKELTDLKNNFAEEIAKYALKSDLNSLATKDELQKASEKAATELQNKLNDYLKADVLASLATKDDIRDLQNKEAVQNLIKDAIKALKDGDLKSIGDKAEEAWQKANKAESTEGLAYVKALAAEGKAIAAANDAATAKSKAEANETEITTIKNILGNKFDAKNTVSAAIDLINTQLADKKTGLTALAGRLSSIESLLNQDTPDATSLKTRVDNIENKLKNIIGQYSTMVTDIQLYDFAMPNLSGFDRTLKFVQAAEKANVFPAQAGVATEQLKFEEGKYYAGEDSLLIRVSPVDAVLTTSNVSLMNSQGKELNDLIDVTDVHRYDKLLLGNTRAGGTNTGLWVVRFKAKDLGENFEAAAAAKDERGALRSILYSVAVKNTYNTTDKAEDANTRRVTSEFGVDLKTSNAEHAWDFDVNGNSVAGIRNRYYRTETGTPTREVPELVWKNDAATTVVTDNEDESKNNAVNRPSWSDYNPLKDCRQRFNILAVEKGKDITIDFSNTELKGVKGFYVTLDEAFAKESSPSELNAWNSYTYKGVGYHKNGGAYVPAELFKGRQGKIRIENLGNVQGDVIGFRVYAVNYDGTLYDPDGRSFYVAVGDVKTEMPLANAKAELDMATPTQFVSNLIEADFSKVDFDGYKNWKISEKDVAECTPLYGDFEVKYFDKDKNETGLNKDVKFIQFVLNHPQEFVDGQTYNASMTLTKNISGATAEVCNVTASFTKVMPTAAPTFCYRDGYSKTPEYIIPEGGDYTVGSDNKGGSFKLNNLLIIDNNNTWKGADLFEASTAGKFSFNVSNGTYDAGKKNIVSAKADAPYVLDVVNGKNNLVDNKTERTIAANYIYYNISKQYNKETKHYEPVHEYPVPSASSEKIVYCSWMKTLAVKTALKSTWTGIKGDGDGKNVVTWKATGNGGATLDLANLQTEISDLKLLPAGALIADGNSFGGLIDANVVEVVKVKYDKVYTTDKNNTQVNPHFSAEFVGSKIVLTQRAESTVAPSTTAGNIHFTVKDCFGNTKEIVLPFYIKK